MSKNRKLADCYGSYHYFNHELVIIINRIGNDLTNLESVFNNISEWHGKFGRVSIPQELMNQLIEYDSMLMLDLKDLYIHTRIFLDTLANIIKISYGKRGYNLSNSMHALLTKSQLLQIDPAFFTELRSTMSWFSEFKENRDKIVHSLGRFIVITGSGESQRYRLINHRNESWDNNPTGTSVKEFVEGAALNLKQVLEFLSTHLEFKVMPRKPTK